MKNKKPRANAGRPFGPAPWLGRLWFDDGKSCLISLPEPVREKHGAAYLSTIPELSIADTRQYKIRHKINLYLLLQRTAGTLWRNVCKYGSAIKAKKRDRLNLASGLIDDCNVDSVSSFHGGVRVRPNNAVSKSHENTPQA